MWHQAQLHLCWQCLHFHAGFVFGTACKHCNSIDLLCFLHVPLIIIFHVWLVAMLYRNSTALTASRTPWSCTRRWFNGTTRMYRNPICWRLASDDWSISSLQQLHLQAIVYTVWRESIIGSIEFLISFQGLANPSICTSHIFLLLQQIFTLIHSI